jgi:hypothetical protein
VGVVVKHISLNETAYEIIRDKILKGEFPLGSRLREDLLVEEISMSRTPVREAINRSIESPFMAGVSGGRKAICPGLIGEESMYRVPL